VPLLKPRITSVPIYQGDDLEHLAELRMAAEIAGRKVDMAAQKAPRPLRDGDTSPAEELAQQAAAARDAYDAFVDQAAERAVIVEIQALGHVRWAALVAKHQPRTRQSDGEELVEPDDADYGVDTTSFPQALLTYLEDERRTIVGPAELLEAAALVEFLAEISDGDYERLWTSGYWLNRAPGVDPKDTQFSADSRS
jgi:hypothetical protein